MDAAKSCTRGVMAEENSAPAALWVRRAELVLGLLVALVWCLAVGVSFRHQPAPPEEESATESAPVVIGPGHEREVLRLVAPAEQGRELTRGWALWDISIERTRILFSLRGPTTERPTLELRSLSFAARPGESCSRTAHYLLCRVATHPDAMLALGQLEQHVRAHDPPRLFRLARATTRGLPDWVLRLADASTDGLFLMVLLLCFLLAVVLGQLESMPRWARWGLLGIFVYGLAMRLLLSMPVPMNAWSNERVVPLARAVYEGPLARWLSAVLHVRIPLLWVLYNVDLALASLMPLALFAHARYVLREWKPALAAALLIAALPMHLRFSRSDVEFVQSLFGSSMTFLVLYGALTHPRRGWRRLNMLALPLLCLGTYLTRPENMMFFPLDLGAIVLATWGGKVDRKRAAVVLLGVSLAAAIALVKIVFGAYRRQVGEGLALETLKSALLVLLSPRQNTLLNPWTMSPLVPVLVFVGARSLWQRGERFRVGFLLAWLLSFFVVQAYVVPRAIAMQSRYHLHLVTPFVLLAACSVWRVEQLERKRQLLVGLLVVSMPLVHSAYLRDADFYEIQEHLALRAMSARIPDHATVLEYNAPLNRSRSTEHMPSPLRRFALELREGFATERFRVVELAQLAQDPQRPDTLTEAARQRLSSQSSLVYLGLSCYTQREVGSPEAQVCAELERSYRIETLERRTLRAHIYDDATSGRMIMDGSRAPDRTQRVRDYDPLTIRLLRTVLPPEENR